MRIHVALLFSLCLHAALIFGPAWLSSTRRPEPSPRIEARLLPAQDAETTAESVSTEAPTTRTRTKAPEAAQALHGATLRQAQAALTRHLYYPPEAVSRGIEGEVILLLTLTETGLLTGVDIARSSGHPLLDRAAVDAARQIGSLPGAKRQMLFPVSFRLQ